MTDVIESTQTADRILTAMSELMRRQGYGATSVKQVVEAAQAPIGSLYHFFPGGKREIAASALRLAGDAYIALVPTVMDRFEDLHEAVLAFFVAAAEDAERAEWATMCPVVTVAAETADVEPELRGVCAEIVTSWVDQASRYFSRRGLSEPAARELTLHLLAALEGAFMITRILRSREPLLAAGRHSAVVAEQLSRHQA